MARAYVGHRQQTLEIIKQAISHNGYALVDILQPCVTFNQINTYQWFEQHTDYLADGHDSSDRMQAFARAIEAESMYLGVFYRQDKPVFEAQLDAFVDNPEPLYRCRVDVAKLQALAAQFK